MSLFLLFSIWDEGSGTGVWNLLMEDGFNILMEDGSSVFLLE